MGAHRGGRQWGRAEGALALPEPVFVMKNLPFLHGPQGRPGGAPADWMPAERGR